MKRYLTLLCQNNSALFSTLFFARDSFFKGGLFLADEPTSAEPPVSRQAALLGEFVEKTGASAAEAEALVQKKRGEFAGLLSEEAAIKILCREAGVAVVEEEVPVEFMPLASISAAGERANVFVRVKNVFAPREFEKEKRKGRVCNISVADESAGAMLVLWNRDVDLLVESGKIERNDLLEIIGTSARSLSPLELNSSLLTQISVKKESELPEGGLATRAAKIPKNEIAVKKLSEISATDAEVDAFARVLKVFDEKEFTRQDGKKGKVASLLVSDGTKQMRLVLWDKNADIVRRAKVGDAVKVESAYCKQGQNGELELHAGWKGRVVPNPYKHDLAEKEKIWKELYSRCLLSELAEGKEAIASGRVAEIYDAKTILKCKECNATIPKPQTLPNGLAEGTKPVETIAEQLQNAGSAIEPPEAQEQLRCPSCGSANSRDLLIVTAELDDGTASVRTTFFGKTGLELLGINDLTLDAQTVLSLKKEFLLGENLLLVLAGKKNPNSGALEATCKHIISRRPKASDDVEFVKEKL